MASGWRGRRSRARRHEARRAGPRPPAAGTHTAQPAAQHSRRAPYFAAQVWVGGRQPDGGAEVAHRILKVPQRVARVAAPVVGLRRGRMAGRAWGRWGQCMLRRSCSIWGHPPSAHGRAVQHMPRAANALHHNRQVHPTNTHLCILGIELQRLGGVRDGPPKLLQRDVGLRVMWQRARSRAHTPGSAGCELWAARGASVPLPPSVPPAGWRQRRGCHRAPRWWGPPLSPCCTAAARGHSAWLRRAEGGRLAGGGAGIGGGASDGGNWRPPRSTLAPALPRAFEGLVSLELVLVCGLHARLAHLPLLRRHLHGHRHATPISPTMHERRAGRGRRKAGRAGGAFESFLLFSLPVP